MAASRTVPNTPLLNRYNVDEDVVEQRALQLPGGGCNWTNLSLGLNAPKCGCKRFWDKGIGTPSITGASAGNTGFCMCEHHACYHDFDHQGAYASAEVGSATPKRQTSQALRPVLQDENAQVRGVLRESALPDTMNWSRNVHGSPQGLPAIPSQCLLPSDNGSLTSGSQTAFFRPFGGKGLNTLDQVPRNNLGNPSALRAQLDNPRMQIYEDAHGNAYLQSLTEVATPSARASQDQEDLGRHVASVHNALETIVERDASQSATLSKGTLLDHKSQVLVKHSAQSPRMDPTDYDTGKRLVPHHQKMVDEIPERVANHERRIDLLENASFTNGAIDDLQETTENIDTRVGELEGRVDELEKAQAVQTDASSFGSRQIMSGSFDSRASNTSSAMIADAMDRIDPSRVEALEAQVAELQAIAPPSYSRPWEVEVVFLPFGLNLMGIWSAQHHGSQRSRLGSTATEDWTQTQHNSLALAQATLNAHDQVYAWEHSVTDQEEYSPWLMARACGLHSRVDERLRSRGLVRTVYIRGPDARDVQAAILTAFEDLPSVLAEDPFGSQDENVGAIPKSLQHYIGLRAPWIPLRKLHKDSRLKFLSPSEMLTDALWTVPFLSSSVAMRHSKTRRLYITQRDSYMQHLCENTANWTWQKLRQLPRVYPDSSSLSHTPEADAHEPCWAFDAHLDPPLQSIHSSANSSFASQISSLSIQSPGTPDFGAQVEVEPASPSDHFSSAAVSPTNSTPRTSVAPPPPSSPLKERHPFRPVHSRTTSMPTLIPLIQSGPSSSQQATSKRRVDSYDQDTHSSPSRMASTSVQTIRSLENKRRRISRSPSRPHDASNWSAGPPSPYPELEGGDKKRHTTPFAYATPHSNAPYVPRSAIDIYEDHEDDEHGSLTDELNFEEGADIESGYEQNALSDYEDEQSVDHQGEWAGVAEEGSYESGLAGDVTSVVLRHSAPGEAEAGAEEDDVMSDASSQPSEYPSTQQPEYLNAGKAVGLFERRQKREPGFKIHVDEEHEGTTGGQVK